MKYLYKLSDEKKEDVRGRGTWPWLRKKLSLLIVGDVLVLEGTSKKELKRVRRTIGTISQGVGARFTWGRYIETPRFELRPPYGRFRLDSDWQIEGRVTSSVKYSVRADAGIILSDMAERELEVAAVFAREVK